MTDQPYPGVSLRVKAVVTDSILLVIAIILVTYLFDWFHRVPDVVRIVTFVLLFVLYDPLFTSLFGGTIGHMIFGIRVKREKNPQKNILFPLAILRYIVKALLGWISLLTVMSNPKAKAIHDYAVGSIVVFVDAEND